MNANQPARNWVKHARTPHLPWSDGVSSDDKVIPSLSGFLGKQVIVTEKMDGESTSIYSDGIHARSLDSGHHPSRTRVKALQSELAGVIPRGWRIVGENIQVEHSIHYNALPSSFLVIAIFDKTNTARPWDETVAFCLAHNLDHVPILYEGVWDERAVKSCWSGMSRFSGEQEGYVVRVADAIAYNDWGTQVGKCVRKGHVQHDAEHWLKSQMVPNGLAGNP